MKDVLERAGLVNRKFEKRQHEGRPACVVILESTYDTDISDLWDALTNKERLSRWFSPVEGDFRPGGHYQIKGNASGTITRCEEQKHFDLTCEFAGDVSWVKVELIALQQSGTRLRLEHLAYIEGEHFKIYGPGAVGVGWDLAIAGLHYHIRTKQAINETEFMALPEGKKYISFCANAWGEATINAGYDREESLAAAKRTEKFYLGEPS